MILRSPLLDQIPNVRHGFLTRQGGRSPAPFDSLNLALSKGDDLKNVFQNQKISLEMLGTPKANFRGLKQIHGSEVHKVEHVENKEVLEGDALVTKHPQTALNIITADCVPVLISSLDGNVIGAAHAGWRGTLSGIIQNVVQALQKCTKMPLVAAIGPCIHQESYEISSDVYEAFTESAPTASSFFIPSPKNPGHHLFDLPGVVKLKLEEAGVEQIDRINHNTYTNEDLFFSCRRSFHKQEKTFGCQGSLIVKV
ncbi:MAG: peptidoglycan editing factor PgeF [bacterium]|nr:peptidoglycan editing factor PgeF [bacterium]